jgi:hypothetical protein
MRLAGSNNAYGTAIALQINRRDLSASRDGTFHGVACSVRPDNAVILIGPAGPAHFGADDRKKTVRALMMLVFNIITVVYFTYLKIQKTILMLNNRRAR